jgi:subtilisin family serine protease
MRRLGHDALAVVCALAALLAARAHAAVPLNGPQSRFTVPHIPAQLLVRPALGTTEADIVGALAAFGGAVVAYLATADLYVVEIDDDMALRAAVTLLEADARIALAEPNYVFSPLGIPNDPQFAEQWSKKNTGINAPNGLGTPGADMNLPKAWDIVSTAPGVTLAIIDNGFETTHADLLGNLLPGKCFASPGSPRPCTNGPDDPSPADDADVHGTLVAGAAAARGNNAIGIAGAVWETNVLPLKVDLSAYAIVAAIDDALASGADIINMSFGGPIESQAEKEALGRAESARVLVVAAAGNADASNDHASMYPAYTDLPNVLSVAATTSEDKIASFSEWGPFGVDLAAPGELILSTAIHGGYARASGTSFAAPHLAGVAALVAAETLSLDYRDLKAHLLYGGTDGVTAFGPTTPGVDERAIPGRVATGRLDAAKALENPPGGVIVIRSVTVDDTASGDGDHRLDPGETARLEVTLENLWRSESTVMGTLAAPAGGLLTVNDAGPVLFGAMDQDSRATASFGVTLAGSAAGNQQIFMRLDLSSAAQPALPSRYFYLETGTLTNGVTLSQQIGRWDWDEFQAFHLNVPAGATNLEITTTGSGDVDLLVRREEAPEYLITLGGDGFYYTDDETQVSGGPGADESVSIASPLPGVYHVVVVNFDGAAKTYGISASYSTAQSSGISFSVQALSVDESAAAAIVTVARSGGIEPASIQYATAAVSAAAGADYTDVAGTLSWKAGETGAKTFSVPILDDDTAEGDETVDLTLSNASGDSLGSPSTATLRILDDDAPTAGGGGDGGSGSGNGDGDGGTSSGGRSDTGGGGGGTGLGSLLALALISAARLARRPARARGQVCAIFD